MTNEEKKEWLLRYKDSLDRIDSITEQMAAWRARAEKVTQTITGMPRGSSGKELCDIIAMMEEKQSYYKRELVCLNRIELEIDIAIKMLDDANLISVLEYRYKNLYSWESIAIRMGYSIQHCWRLHGIALKKLNIRVNER